MAKLTGDGSLPLAYQHVRVQRQVNIDARTETDEPDPFARGERIARRSETYDPSRHQSGDLNNSHRAVLAFDDQSIAFVFLACLVEIRIDELARRVDNFLDPAGNR